MKYFQKESTQNKGSIMLSCVLSILFILLLIGIIIINNSIMNTRNKSHDVLLRIFEENKINEMYYTEEYELLNQSYEVCGDVFAMYNSRNTIDFQNAKGSYRHIFTYEVDDTNKIKLIKLEVYGE